MQSIGTNTEGTKQRADATAHNFMGAARSSSNEAMDSLLRVREGAQEPSSNGSTMQLPAVSVHCHSTLLMVAVPALTVGSTHS